MNGYTIVKDTREQHGYEFTAYGSCEGYVDKQLETGDYSILGLEDQICIERKASTTELAVNLGSDKERFMAEIERMQIFPHKFLILEFSMEDMMVFPAKSSIPVARRKFIKSNGAYLLKSINEIQTVYGIPVTFCGDKRHAQQMVSSILKRIYEIYSS